MSDDLRALISRLEKVEKSNRRLRMMVFTALLIAAVSLILPSAIRTVCRAAKIYPTLAVSGVVVYDEDGTQRGYFGYLSSPLDAEGDSGSPSLTLSYPSGRPAISLRVHDFATSVTVHDEDMRMDASLHISSLAGPSLLLNNEKTFGGLRAKEDGVVLLAKDLETKQWAELQFSVNTPYLAISDKEKNTLWSAP